MMKTYLKQARRSLSKNKMYSILNIAGLSAGLTCFAFIALWVKDELSFDKFNKNYDRIVRVVGTAKMESGVTESAVTSAPMAQALKNDYPEVENAVRFEMREEIVKYKDQQVLQPGILLTDPSFFDVFSYKISKGNIATVLKDPYSVILTESTAKKYFGDEDPIGKTLTINMYDDGGSGVPYKVTGIMPDPTENAHFTFTILGSFKTVEAANPDVLTVDGWGDGSFYTYLLLKDGVDQKAFSKKISHFYGKYIGDRFESWRNIYSYQLQPLKDIYLRSKLKYEIAATGNISQVYLFSAIGIFILLLAGINYINLAIAGSIKRAKEIGVKKIVGAVKSQLVIQYLLESVLTTLIALSVSLFLCFLLQPLFSQITGKEILPFTSPLLLLFLAGVSVLLGLLSGLYPAFVISGFRPLRVLKGNFQQGNTGVLLRKSLVVAQFTITLILVTGIIIINAQNSFIKNKNLGYNKDALIFLRVHGNSDVIKGYAAFKDELLSNPLVATATTSNSLPITGLGTGGSETVDINGKPLQVNTARLRADADYLRTYKIDLVAGQDFKKGAATDTIRPIILNEAAVQKFGWKDPQSAIGKPFKMGGTSGEVVGVIRNFHFSSLHEIIEPLAIYPNEGRFSRITLNADIAKAGASLAWIEQVWKKHFPAALLDYNFLDKQVGEQYLAEERFSKIVLYFSLISLLIACLGLYGLISFAAAQKVKEIGVRKVLGASVRGITVMLSKDFLKLVVIALLIATPVAWYVMQSWLQNFAYRAVISWWMFFAAGSGVIIMAMITVSFQAIKAAVANPVKSLRTE